MHDWWLALVASASGRLLKWRNQGCFIAIMAETCSALRVWVGPTRASG
jgi:hypothetical protein